MATPPVGKHYKMATTGKFAKGGAVKGKEEKEDVALLKKMVKPTALNKKCGGRVK